ncbi:MAG: GNAT family N-acetyltransferase [Bacteroidales bacterium]|jgi:ElaA protein|nr:GNAT family N-acetyltransferase [Bacteroidales bacterium]
MFKIQYRVIDTADDLQKALFIRGVVFIEEQHCAYWEELDGQDSDAIHFLATIDDEPVGTARMLVFDDYAKVGRLAVRKAYRGKGIGKELLQYVLQHAAELGYSKIKIHAQAYLVGFYEDFGFVKQGEKFLEANIEHYYMEKG